MGKLSNPGFLAKAPEAVINGAKDDAAKLKGSYREAGCFR